MIKINETALVFMIVFNIGIGGLFSTTYSYKFPLGIMGEFILAVIGNLFFVSFFTYGIKEHKTKDDDYDAKAHSEMYP